MGRGGVGWGDPCRSEELGLLQRCGAREKEQIRPLAVVPPPETPGTHLLPPHGFKHLLKLDTELLDVVHQDAGLEGQDGGGQHQHMWLQQPPVSPPPCMEGIGAPQRRALQYFGGHHRAPRLRAGWSRGPALELDDSQGHRAGTAASSRRYVTTFSFSLEQYEAKSLEMISAYCSSTLLMVCSRTRDGDRPGERQTDGGRRREEDRESHGSKATPRAGIHAETPGPTDAPGAWAQPDRAHPVSAGSSVLAQAGRHRLPSTAAAPSHAAASRWHLIN